MHPEKLGSSRANRWIIRSFARALSSALYDTSLEREGNRIIYYHDADVVFRLVRGFQGLRRTSSISRKQLVVGSLLSSGYLGKVNLLRPHALELDSNIRLWLVRAAEENLQGFRREAEIFLKANKTLDEIHGLLAIIGSGAPLSERIELFFNTLETIAVDTFVSLELTSGPWEYRLRRLVKSDIGGEVLSISELGYQIKHVLMDPVFIEFRSMVSGEGARPELSDFRDALALSMLCKMVQARNGRNGAGEGLPLVRFYTETPTLKEVWSKNPKMRSYLTYEPNNKSEARLPASARTAWRDANYFLVRAIFEELRFPEVDLSESFTDGLVSRGDLEKLAVALRDVAGESDQEIVKKMSALSVAGKPLADVIQELETLSFVNRVWIKYKPTKAAKSLVENIEQVWTFAKGQRATRKLRQKIKGDIESLTTDLSRGVEEMREWFASFRQFFAEAVKLKKEMSEYEIPDPMRDLGLVRWGCSVSSRSIGRIRVFWEKLFAREDQETASACEELAYEIDSLDDAEDCLVACSVLWFLGLFERVVETIDKFTKGRWYDGAYNLAVMRSAAHLRGGGKIDRVEKLEIISRLTDKAGKQGDPEEQGHSLLGLGYVLFYCWFLENRLLIFDTARNEDELSRQWLFQSAAAGRRAVELLQPGSLAGAFALNHCVYVGSVGNILPDETKEFAWKLSLVSSVRDVWNYRFADTFAYRGFLEAMRLHKVTQPQGPGLHRQLICDHLENAQLWIDKATPSFGDSEIEEHRAQIRQLKIDAGCASPQM
jgi:hypothetical protein